MFTYQHKPTGFFTRILGIIVMMLVIIAASGQSAANAAYSNNQNQGQAPVNSVHQPGNQSLAGSDQVPPAGSSQVNSISSANFSISCGASGTINSNVSITGVLSPVSGYAGLRVWVVYLNGTTATVYDSYVAGYPSYFAPGDLYGNFSINVSFVNQGPGDAIKARVYRAPSATTGSYDGQGYLEQTHTCTGTHIFDASTTLTCSGFSTSGFGYPYSGYAAVRLWKGSQTIIDSYVSGFPTYYAPIQADGSFSINASFAQQSVGSSLTARVYRAPSATTGSWDSGYYDNYTVNC